MKKKVQILFVIFFVLISTIELSGQSTAFGFKGGLNLSRFNNFDEDIEQEFYPRIFIGAFGRVELQENIFLQPEFLYALKGSRVIFPNNDEVKYKFDYLEIPFLLVFKPEDMVNMHFGPYFGYLISAEAELEDPFVFSGLTINSDLNEEEFERFDVGLSMGLGIEADILEIGADFNLGLTPLVSDNKNRFLYDAKNMNVRIYAALKFGG